MSNKVKIGTQEDRLALASILIKNGYTVRITSEKKDRSKPNGGSNYFVEFWEGSSDGG